jgi:GSH-dependent disulfide-bond oxidoreductase
VLRCKGLEPMQHTIDLYGSTSPNVGKVVLMLEECGLPYTFHFMNVWKGDQFAPEFTTMNPNQKVPVLKDGNAVLFESGAILIYLAEKQGRFLPAKGQARYEVLQWLMLQMASFGPMLGQHNHFLRYATGTHPYSAARYRSEAKRLLGLLEARLATSMFVAGDYSIADMALYPWIRLLENLSLNPEAYPSITRWQSVIAERPSGKALERWLSDMQQLAAGARSGATEEDKDRFFIRGRFSHAD